MIGLWIRFSKGVWKTCHQLARKLSEFLQVQHLQVIFFLRRIFKLYIESQYEVLWDHDRYEGG